MPVVCRKGSLNSGLIVRQNWDRQAELDRGFGEPRRATRAPIMRRKPGHLLVQPDQP